MRCPECGGRGVFLGTLGDVEQYRCRHCGWEYEMKTVTKCVACMQSENIPAGSEREAEQQFKGVWLCREHLDEARERPSLVWRWKTSGITADAEE